MLHIHESINLPKMQTNRLSFSFIIPTCNYISVYIMLQQISSVDKILYHCISVLLWIDCWAM